MPSAHCSRALEISPCKPGPKQSMPSTASGPGPPAISPGPSKTAGTRRQSPQVTAPHWPASPPKWEMKTGAMFAYDYIHISSPGMCWGEGLPGDPLQQCASLQGECLLFLGELPRHPHPPQLFPGWHWLMRRVPQHLQKRQRVSPELNREAGSSTQVLRLMTPWTLTHGLQRGHQAARSHSTSIGHGRGRHHAGSDGGGSDAPRGEAQSAQDHGRGCH